MHLANALAVSRGAATSAAEAPAARRVVTPATRAIVSALAAALALFAMQPADAQNAPPPDAMAAPDAQDAPDAANAAAQDTDPPGRVARLNYMAGTVTTEPAGANDWSYAQVNRPLTTGDQLWTDKGARSELHIGSTAVRAGESTSVDILNLDDDSTQLKVAQGTLSTHVRALPAGSSYEIDTPNLALGVSSPGDYRVDVAPDGSATTVTVRSGGATAYGDGGQLPIAAGQQIRFTGTSLQQIASNGAPGPDSLDQWAASRDATEDRSVSARYVSRDMPGYQDLDANGTWRSDPQYGEVWTPNQVAADWAPYRDGHWVWQAPWGWTWVDDAPWGFAPYHYGRWAYVGNTWAWVPGPIVVSEPPVYAPALVAFVGDGGGGVDWGVSLAIGGVAAAGLAWFPLGPGEPWHPHWGHGWSPRYYDRVNRPVYGHNAITNVHNTYVNYRAPRAVTCVPATAFVHGQPVNRFAQKVDPRQWRNARFNPGAPGIAPVRQSFGPGLRNAAYRPPAAAMTRPVVATRRPDVPPAYRDQLAQRFARGGGRVPGAGNPVVHASVPARFGDPRIGNAGMPAQNVRLVQSHAPDTAAHGLQGGPPNVQRPVMGQGGGRGAPNAQQFGASGEGRAGMPRQMPAQAGSGTPQPAAQPRPQLGNSVPHPPQFAGGNGSAAAQPGAQGMGGGRFAGGQTGGQQPGPRAGAQPGVQAGAQPGPQAGARESGQPAWTQRHTPMAQQSRPSFPQQANGPQPVREARQPMQPQQPRPVPEARQPMQTPQRSGFSPAQPQQARPQAMPQQVQQPRPQPAPQQVQQPRPQPVPQQVQQPRPEFHPQQAQQPRPQPVQQARPPQQAQQPRPEFHPQQVQQPRPQPIQQPHPQPQPRQEQRATGGGHDDHRRS
jgi:hypothetical protein